MRRRKWPFGGDGFSDVVRVTFEMSVITIVHFFICMKRKYYASTQIKRQCVDKRDKTLQWRCRGSNPGPFTCKANALPLSHIPNCYCIRFALQLIVILFDTYIVFFDGIFISKTYVRRRNASAA